MNEADTPTTMLPPVSVPRAAPSSPVWYRDRWVLGFVVLGLLGLLGVAYFMMPAQWIGRITPGHSVVDDGAVALTPGSARPTDGRIEITDLPTFDPVGEILFTTVGIDDQVTIRDWVRSVRDDAVFLRSREEVFGTRTAEEQRERNLQLMAVSKDSAVVAALRHLGVEAVIETGVGFNQVVADGPAEGLLVVGEVIVAVDGEPVTGIDSLVAILQAREPGESVTLSLEHAVSGETRVQELVLGVHPEGRSGGFIGIGDITIRAVDADLPFEIAIDSGSVGGPSAGLAFTLALIDVLTEGELTGGARVAVTGTISGEGAVGGVGGVAQKARAAEQEGAAIFIVPAQSVAEAESTTDGLTVVGVDTLDGALAALADLGGEVEGLRLDFGAAD